MAHGNGDARNIKSSHHFPAKSLPREITEVESLNVSRQIIATRKLNL